MFKTFMASLVLVLAVACGACSKSPQYGPTEGPFRARFAKPVEMVMMDATPQYVGIIFFDGVLPAYAVHIEGYVNDQLRFHTDATIGMRMQYVTVPLTKALWCEAIGQPMRDPGDFFERYGGRETPPYRGEELFDEQDVPDGTLTVTFKFFQLDPQKYEGRGEYLTEATARVKLTCTTCGRCLPGQPI